MKKEVRIPAGVFSYSGDIPNNGVILIDGTTDDWSLFVFPKHFRTPPEGESDKDNALMGVEVIYKTLDGKIGWRVGGIVTWRRGLNHPPVPDDTEKSIPVISFLVVRNRLPAKSSAPRRQSIRGKK